MTHVCQCLHLYVQLLLNFRHLMSWFDGYPPLDTFGCLVSFLGGCLLSLVPNPQNYIHCFSGPVHCAVLKVDRYVQIPYRTVYLSLNFNSLRGTVVWDVIQVSANFELRCDIDNMSWGFLSPSNDFPKAPLWQALVSQSPKIISGGVIILSGGLFWRHLEQLYILVWTSFGMCIENNSFCLES